MVPQYQRIPVQTHLRRLALALVAVAALSVPFINLAYAQSDPLPQEIRDLKMGSSAAAVTEKIKSVGTFLTEPIKAENRTLLVWTRPDLPYYRNIAFQFTERDRLYLIRFTLSDAARADYHSLKRTVFKDYDFSWERPQKLRLPTREMLLYGPEKGMDLYFIEFTDKKSHEKSFELFNRAISAADRPEPLSIAKKNGLPENPESGQPPTSVKEGQKPAAGEDLGSAKPSAPVSESQKPAIGEKTESPQGPQVSPKPEAK